MTQKAGDNSTRKLISIPKAPEICRDLRLSLYIWKRERNVIFYGSKY
jgi:hypothetical protein